MTEQFDPGMVDKMQQLVIDYLKQYGVTGFDFVTESNWQIRMKEKEVKT